MPIRSAINDLVPEVRTWRRELHQNPEIMYDVEETAKFVADRLRAFGCDEVKTAIGRTGVVGVIHGARGSSSRSIGLRADMDALPIAEETNLPYRSKVPGKMHACGHDGHTAMLLGAAQRLAQTRDFSGAAIVIFQPAEEGGAGAMAMIDDGLLDQFGIEQVYGMHNWPGAPVGSFALRKGPLMAAADEITITIEGKGGHGALPHQCIDPVVVGAQIIIALQTIASRNVDPLDSCVVSITRFEAGTANNIIPQSAWLNGTVRTLKAATRDRVEKRIHEIAAGLAEASGATARIEYRRGYPPTVNHSAQTDFAASIARKVAGDAHVDANAPPTMGSEDFSFMLEARPGAFIFIGNGDSAMLHHPSYDFNDEVLPYGMSYWVELVETALAP
jgi:hippurate hydrolase